MHTEFTTGILNLRLSTLGFTGKLSEWGHFTARTILETFTEPSQTWKIEVFAKLGNGLFSR